MVVNFRSSNLKGSIKQNVKEELPGLTSGSAFKIV